MNIYQEKQSNNLNTYILNFNIPKLLTEIRIGYLITKVETYIPNPLRCHNCQKFGHHKEKCTRPPTCKNCRKTGNYIDCQQPPKCANCKQNHSADSKECELWKKEKRILEMKHTKNISYLKARKFIENSLATTIYANSQTHKQLYPKSRNDDSLRHDKSNKRIEETTWITKGKLDQLNN